MKRVILFVAIFSVLFMACTKDKATPAEKLGIENAKENFDWQGTYEGTVPCASCPGIETTLVLADGTYELVEQYLENDNYDSKGTFHWTDDNTVIVLDNDNENSYLVGEGILYQLNDDNELVEGELEKDHQLKKVSSETTYKKPEPVITSSESYSGEDGEYNVTYYEEDGKKFVKIERDGEVNIIEANADGEYRDGTYTVAKDANSNITINGKLYKRNAKTTNQAPKPTMKKHYQTSDNEIWVAYYDNVDPKYVVVTHNGNEYKLPLSEMKSDSRKTYSSGDKSWEIISKTGIFDNGETKYEFTIRE